MKVHVNIKYITPLFFLFALLIGSGVNVAQVLSQDDPAATEDPPPPAEPPLPTEAPPPTDPPLPTETPLLPTDPPTEAPTATPLPPTETPSPTSELTAEPVLTEAATAELTPETTAESATVEATSAATAEATVDMTAEVAPTVTADIVPERALTLLSSTNFDYGVSNPWTWGAEWLHTELLSDRAPSLFLSASDAQARFEQANLLDVAVEMHVWLLQGEARLGVRQSVAGSYTAVLSQNGAVSLYRGDTLFAAGSIALDPDQTWHRLRLSAVDDVLRVAVNGQEVISILDDAPLPPGALSFSGAPDGTSALFVDDVSIWAGEEDVPEMQAILSALEVEADASVQVLPAEALAASTTYTRMVYVSTISGNSDIYILNPEVPSIVYRVTFDTASDSEPRLSPDGSKIAFVSYRNGNAEIYVVDANGANLRRLTENSSGDFSPVWSPNGSYIAFISERDGNPELYVMNADGSGTRRLTATSAAEEYITWSPASNRIAYVSRRDGNREIYAINVDGTGDARLTNNSGNDVLPLWSPNGTYIAFTRFGSDFIFRTYSMANNGTSQRQLTFGTLSSVANDWSGSNRILYINSSGTYTISPTGGSGTLLNTVQGNQTQYSPDSSKIGVDTQGGIYTLPGTGGSLTKIVGSGYSFSWEQGGAVQPIPSPTPTLAPTFTPTPTTTPAPIGVYHVSCALANPANVRNFPAGQTLPTPQIDGRVIFTLPPGTVVDVYELRPARDGIDWARISHYEDINGRDTLWIRTKQPDNTTDILLPGTPTVCATATPNFTQSTLIPPTPSYPIGTPGCLAGRDCPHTSSTITDVDLVSFILACEAGAGIPNPPAEAISDAVANAHVIYNRMDSGLYAGTAREVVTQLNQWQPYNEGCESSLGLEAQNLSQIAPAIRQAATNLVNRLEPAAPFNPSIDHLALYTFGVPNPNHTAAPPPIETLLAPFCPGGASQALRVYLAIASFGNGARPNASVFFSDSPGCQL